MDTVHTTKEQLKKIALFIEQSKAQFKTLTELETPNNPGEVHALMKHLRYLGEDNVVLAGESEACIKALLIKDFIETVELPEPPKTDTVTVPRVLWDSIQRRLKEIPKDETWGYDG